MDFRELLMYLILLVASLSNLYVVQLLPINLTEDTSLLTNDTIADFNEQEKNMNHKNFETRRLRPDSNCVRTNRYYQYYRNKIRAVIDDFDFSVPDLSHEQFNDEIRNDTNGDEITNASYSIDSNSGTIYEKNFSRYHDPFQDNIGRVFHKASLNHDNPLNPVVYHEESNENDQLFESTLKLQRYFFHIVHCMNLCIDIENEFQLQEHLFKRNEGGEIYLQDLDQHYMADTIVGNKRNLEARLEIYIKKANQCFGDDKQDIKLLNDHIRKNLEKDLIDLLEYLRINNFHDEKKNLKFYFNTVRNTLTENSGMERW